MAAQTGFAGSVKSLNCQVEYEAMQVKMNLESPIRISTHSVMAGIFNEYIIMAKQEIVDITARLGDWEELFDQEAGGK